MNLESKIYIAGHLGLVGSALVRNLRSKGYGNLISRTHTELDLTIQAAVDSFFAAEKPEYVFLAAARVGGIHANDTYPAEFIRDNLAIQTNIIHAAYRNQVKRLLFLGSSCIYHRHAPQPLREEYLLTGELEPTNRAYALAKIAGIEMCWSYNRQFKTQYLAVMPSNLYGPGDNYHPENSHVIPALIRRFHEAKLANAPSVTVWGTGTPRREFLHSDDMADACVYLMNLGDETFASLLGQDRNHGLPPLINIGVGRDLTIRELAEAVGQTVGYEGSIEFDVTKPDGTPRKLMDVGRLNAMGWRATTDLRTGLAASYLDFFYDRTIVLMRQAPLVTVAVPSFNQGEFLDDALASIFSQNVPVEVFVVDGGSTDGTLEVIRKWGHLLAGWRSHRDAGQSAAINEGVAEGTAPYVCWLNSDDWFLPAGVSQLVSELERRPDIPMVYGRAWNVVENSGQRYPVWVEAFSERRLALRCIISQPATLIRRTAWEAVGGVDESLHMAMDYDLWWRLFKALGPPQFVDEYFAVNRIHRQTKTSTQRSRHYREAIQVVRRHHGSVPLKWWLAQPYAVWFKSIRRV